MALQSSGAISMSQIPGEFGNGYAISSYYRDNSDPYIGTIPASGQISYDDFYNSSKRTARLRSGLGSTSFTSGYNYRRIGWSVSNGSAEWHPESGSSTGAFGSATRRNNLSTTALLGGIHYFAYGGHRHITISHQSSSNSGWTYCDFKIPIYTGAYVTRTLQRGANPGGGVYRGFKRQTGNSTRQTYYHWSYSYESWQSNNTLGIIGNGLVFAYQQGRDWFVRFR